MREALGAIRNLEQLLGSVRVGPKALSEVVPDARAACRELASATSELLNGLRPHLAEAKPVEQLAGFIEPRIDELESALARAAGGPINASARLTLESTVARVVADIDAARGLIELLETATRGRLNRVLLTEVVLEPPAAGLQANPDTGATVRATLAHGALQAEVLANPYVTKSLLAIAIALVQPHSDDHPSVRIASHDDGSCTISVRPPAIEGESFQIAVPRLVEPTLSCARAAASAAGAQFSFDSETSEATLRWREFTTHG